MRGGWGGAWLALSVLVSCGPPPQEPRAIRPESDVCAECRMTIVPEGHAAEAVDVEGQVLTFDDLGCLALSVHDHPERYTGAAFFVQDAGTRAWVLVKRAILVRALDAPTPMNYGWHAFATLADAQAFAVRHGETVAPSGTGLAEVAADLQGRRWQP